MNKNYRIIVIGESWHGSDCTGLARGFRELGHAVESIGSNQFIPKMYRSVSTRVFRRVLTPFYAHQFNDHIIRQLSIVQPDIVVVFKGNHVQPRTLSVIRDKRVWLCNFYPDISFFASGVVDIDTWPKYDNIFTTKKHGQLEMKEHLGLNNVSYLQHGFDSFVHRPINNSLIPQSFINDVSFIGGWSPNKEKYLCGLASSILDLDLHVWGDRWYSNQCHLLRKSIQGTPIFGDFYAIAIAASKINLGLLQENVGFAPNGDKVTSRTFHIPASGGFLLHERTNEVLEFFEEDKEIACFNSIEELTEKVRYYLAYEHERLQIAKAGYERCIKENRWANRALVIIDKYENKIKQVF